MLRASTRQTALYFIESPIQDFLKQFSQTTFHTASSGQTVILRAANQISLLITGFPKIKIHLFASGFSFRGTVILRATNQIILLITGFPYIKSLVFTSGFSFRGTSIFFQPKVVNVVLCRVSRRGLCKTIEFICRIFRAHSCPLCVIRAEAFAFIRFFCSESIPHFYIS
jgi:hypothetical protein